MTSFLNKTMTFGMPGNKGDWPWPDDPKKEPAAESQEQSTEEPDGDEEPLQPVLG